MTQTKLKQIAVMAGDGIGPEVIDATLQVLSKVSEQTGTHFKVNHCLVGGAAFDEFAEHLPQTSIATAKQCDAILFGSVGGPVNQTHLPKWKDCERNSILALRQAFGFNLNLRPIQIFPELSQISPLKERILQQGPEIDFVIVRELLGDLYFGEHKTWRTSAGQRCAADQAIYTEQQIADVVRQAFKLAQRRKQRICLVHKANVLDISRLWQEIGREVAPEFSEVTYEEMLVDNCAMQLVLAPQHFDVIVTSNLFGDILSDLGAALPGSLGLTPSASLNPEGFGMFEPSGGSAPDIAGQNIANPLAQILSLALLLELQFQMTTVATQIRAACRRTLAAGFLTKDLSPNQFVTTSQFTAKLLEELHL